MNSKSLVSVVLMCYNQKEYIQQAMECILRQKTSYPYEIVVGDDGSKDGSRELFIQYQQQYPELIRLVPEAPNKGVLGNWRDAVKLCRGKYVAVCHCDDYWHNPEKLEKQVSFLESNPDYGLVHSDSHFLLTSNGAIIEDYNKNHQPGIPEGDVFEAMMAGKFFIGTLTVCFRKSIFDQYVDINDFIKAGFIYEDLPTWLEIAKWSRVKYIPESLATYRIMQNSISRPKDLTKKFGFLKNHYVIKKYFIEKYKLGGKLVEEFEIMYHTKKFNMAYKWCSYAEAADSFAFLKEKNRVTAKQRLQKLFLRFPIMHATLKKIKRLYVPKTAIGHV